MPAVQHQPRSKRSPSTPVRCRISRESNGASPVSKQPPAEFWRAFKNKLTPMSQTGKFFGKSLASSFRGMNPQNSLHFRNARFTAVRMSPITVKSGVSDVAKMLLNVHYRETSKIGCLTVCCRVCAHAGSETCPHGQLFELIPFFHFFCPKNHTLARYWPRGANTANSRKMQNTSRTFLQPGAISGS